MSSWYETRIDRQIREAQERGEFDNLPGAGEPLRRLDEPYDEGWWIKDLVRRENITGVAPSTLRLRKDVEDLPETIATEKFESAVRTRSNDLNERIVQAQRGHLDGPPVWLSTLDVEDVVRAWRDRKAEGQRQAAGGDGIG